MAPGKQYDGSVSVGSPDAVTRCDVKTGENKTPRKRRVPREPAESSSPTSHSKKYPASKPPVTTPRAIFPKSGF